MAATTPQTDSRSPSRRALLAGALGGIGAWAAAAIGRVAPARAEGQAVVVGGEYTDATSVTKIQNLTNLSTVLWGASSSGTAVYGSTGTGTGVSGSSASGVGVGGNSTTNVGTLGVSTQFIGVYGSSSGTNVPATLGWSGQSTGVQGFSGGSSLPAAKPKTGVFGYAAQDSSARGVWGESTSGIGVYGRATTGFAGYFHGKVFTDSFAELLEISTPAAPGANRARLFVRDAAGKTQLCIRFPTGAVKVIATES